MAACVFHSRCGTRRTPILKERLFGLTGPEGNHGEDVKEYYFYLDSTPTHSYMKALYKYPQRAFPYAELVAENRRRGKEQPEYELVDTGIFAENRYFDIEVEYAKASPTDLVIRITATNRGPEAAPLHILPTLWFRNTWAWQRTDPDPAGLRADERPQLREIAPGVVTAEHRTLGDYFLQLYCNDSPELLFTDNETNAARLWGGSNQTPFVKDGINEHVVNGHRETVNPAHVGSKVAARYVRHIAPGATETVTLRLSDSQLEDPFADAQGIVDLRRAEADAYYNWQFGAQTMSQDERRIQRQAFAGMLWSKQFYFYEVEEWLDGDPSGPTPPQDRKHGRNADWRHLHNADVISMPDKWEYPWYAAWDLAFHCIPLAMVDADFAKRQLVLMLREWYMHPNGQIPAYEWAFGDVNPPVHAWAAWRVRPARWPCPGPGPLPLRVTPGATPRGESREHARGTAGHRHGLPTSRHAQGPGWTCWLAHWTHTAAMIGRPSSLPRHIWRHCAIHACPRNSQGYWSTFTGGWLVR